MSIRPEQIKAFYRSRAETNWGKRFDSPYPLRRYFSRTMWRVTMAPVAEAALVLDVGCGDGVLAVQMAVQHPRQRVVAMDISQEGVEKTREAAIAHGVADRMVLVVGDAAHLPFRSAALPAVVSCQVLEHLDDFDGGAREIQRVLRVGGVAAIGIPACLNPSAFVLLAGDDYWRISRRSAFAFWMGLAQVVTAWLLGREGVQEGYRGRMDLPHVRRFPWRAVRRLRRSGLDVTGWMADSLLVPYLAAVLPGWVRVQAAIDDRLRMVPGFRSLGLGVVIVVGKGP